MTTAVKKLRSSLLTRLGRESTCEACGDQFNCGATFTGCWCAEIELSDEQRTRLRSRYRECLCRKCLERAARVEEPH